MFNTCYYLGRSIRNLKGYFMKGIKLSMALVAMIAFSGTSALAGSFQVGTVQELAVSHDRATLQLDTSASQIDVRDPCLDSSKPLNFIIDFSKVGGEALYNTVLQAKKEGGVLLINGDGVCIGDEQEGLDSLVPT
jgi:hypothetical protein